MENYKRVWKVKKAVHTGLKHTVGQMQICELTPILIMTQEQNISHLVFSEA